MKRIVSIILALAVVFSVYSIPVFAETPSSESQASSDTSTPNSSSSSVEAVGDGTSGETKVLTELEKTTLDKERLYYKWIQAALDKLIMNINHPETFQVNTIVMHLKGDYATAEEVENNLKWVDISIDYTANNSYGVALRSCSEVDFWKKNPSISTNKTYLTYLYKLTNDVNNGVYDNVALDYYKRKADVKGTAYTTGDPNYLIYIDLEDYKSQGYSLYEIKSTTPNKEN
jgi:hypothetical protein